MLRSTLSAVTVAILTALMPAQVAAENLDGVKVSVKVEEFCGLTATGLEMSVGQQVLQTTVQETCNRASGLRIIARASAQNTSNSQQPPTIPPEWLRFESHSQT